MKQDVFDHLREHYASVAKELSSQAKQAGLLQNPTGVGTAREEVYRTFLERHIPKMCDAFLGGYLFDMLGNASSQMDVIVTGGNTPRFRMSSGNRYIAPLEGTIAVAEIKSQLNKDTLGEALNGCASIPSIPEPEGIKPSYLRVGEERWRETPYKIVFAYDGISADTICGHLDEFYKQRPEIPNAKRPNIVHVLEKYMIMRITSGTTVLNLDGTPASDQPEIGQYHPFFIASDTLAMAWTLIALQERAFLSNHLLYKYDEWHNKIMDRILAEFAG